MVSAGRTPLALKVTAPISASLGCFGPHHAPLKVSILKKKKGKPFRSIYHMQRKNTN